MLRVSGLAVFVWALLTWPASAATKHGSDTDARAGMTLQGRTLTIHFRPPGGAYFRDRVPNGRVDVACGTNLASRGTFVARHVRWPRGRRKLRVRFRRDISRRAVYCIIEEPSGGDLAAVTFIRPERYRHVARGTAPSGAYWRLAARMGRFGEPCVATRAPAAEAKDAACFENFATNGARLGVAIGVPSCTAPETYVFGAVTSAAAAVHVRSGDQILAAAMFPPPRGSALKTKLFAVVLKGRPGVGRVRALDARGRTVDSTERRLTPANPNCGELVSDSG